MKSLDCKKEVITAPAPHNCDTLFLKFVTSLSEACGACCGVHMENFIRPSSTAGTRRAVGDNGYVALHTPPLWLSGLQFKVCGGGGECGEVI